MEADGDQGGGGGDGQDHAPLMADSANYVTELPMRRALYQPAPIQHLTEGGYRVVLEFTHTVDGGDFFGHGRASHYNHLSPWSSLHWRDFMAKCSEQGGLLPARRLRAPGWSEMAATTTFVTIEVLLSEVDETVVGFRYQLLARHPMPPNPNVEALPAPQREDVPLRGRGGRGGRRGGRRRRDDDDDLLELLLAPRQAADGDADADGGEEHRPRQRQRRTAGEEVLAADAVAPAVDAAAAPPPPQAPPPPSDYSKMHALAWGAAEQERLRVQSIHASLSDKKIERIYGRHGHKKWIPLYRHLEPRSSVNATRDFLSSYYVGNRLNAELLPVDVRRGRPWQALMQGQELHLLAEARAHAFSVRDAFTYHTSTHPTMDARYYDMAQYYGRDRIDLEGRPLPPTEAVERALRHKTIEHAVPRDSHADYFEAFTEFWGEEFARSGAPAPSRYPFPDRVFVLRSDCIRAEVMMERPLPARIGQRFNPAELADLGGDPGVLCHALKDVYVDAICKRYAAHGGFQQNVARSIQAHRRGPLPAREDYIHDDDGALEDFGNLLLGQAEREAADDRAADERLRQRIAADMAGIIRFAQLKEKAAAAILDRILKQYDNGAYPGLIDPVPIQDDDRGGGGGDGQLPHEREEGVFLMRLGTADEGGGDGRPMARDEMERAAIAGIEAGTAIQIDYAVPGMGRMGDEAFVGAMAEDQELIERALKVQSRAGTWSAVPEAIVRQEVVIQLRIINEAALVALYERFPSDGPDRDAALQAFTAEAIEKAMNVFMTSNNTAPTNIAIRNSIVRLTDSIGGGGGGGPASLLMRPQPAVNDDDVTHQALSWLLNSLNGPFQLTARTLRTVALTYVAKFEYNYLGEWGKGRVKPNCLLGGPPAAGKSFTLNMTTLLSLPGRTQDMGRMTGASQVTGSSNAFVTRIMHEANPAMFIDENEADSSSSRRRDSGKSGGDSSMVQQMKNMITEKYLSLVTMVWEDDTKKKRVQSIIQSLVDGGWQIALNWSLEKASKALLSRFIVCEYKSRVEDVGAATSFSGQYRPSSIDSSKDFAALIREHHLIDGVISLINYVCSAGAVPGSMLTDVAELLTAKVLEKLVNDFNLPKSNIGSRQKDHVVSIACAFAKFRVGFTALATPIGHVWFAENKCSPFSAPGLTGFIVPRLAVTVGDTIAALTLLDFLFDSTEERDIFELLASELYMSASMSQSEYQKPLRTYVNEMVGTPANIQHVQEVMHEQHTAAVRQYESELASYQEDARTGMPHQAPVPPPPDPSGMGGGARAVIEDHRYITWSLPSPFLDKLADEIASKQLQRIGYQNRKVAIIQALSRLESERITAPYLIRDLTPKRALHLLPGGEQRADQIPIILRAPFPLESGGNGGGGGTIKSSGGKQPHQLAIAAEFFQTRILLPMTQEYKERLHRDLLHRGLSDQEREVFRERIEQTPLQRLAMPEVSIAAAKNEAWVRRQSQPDLFRSSMCLAIRSVLQTSTLGRVGVVPYDKVYDAAEEQPYVHSFITWTAPRSVRLRDPQSGETALLNLSHYLTLLDVPRAADYKTFIIVTNETRVGKTGLAQIGATLGTKPLPDDDDDVDDGTAAVPHDPRSMVANMSTRITRIDLDLDYMIAVARARSLGHGKDAMVERWAYEMAGVDRAEPATSLAADNRINRALRQRIPAWPQKSLSYPMSDILDDIHQLSKTRRALEQHNYAHMSRMSDLYLPRPGAATAGRGEEQQEEETERARQREQEAEDLFG